MAQRPIANPGFPVIHLPPTEADVFRPEDGLHVVVRLLAGNQNEPSCLVLEFDPQHVGESTVAASNPTDTAVARLAAPARLSFVLPKGTGNPLLGTLADLLQSTGAWLLRLPPQAKSPQPRGQIAPPGERDTAIELPYRLVLAPAGETMRWLHDSRPAVLNERVSLWHTRLAGEDVRGSQPGVRAVWSPDYDGTSGSDAPAPAVPVPNLPIAPPIVRHEIVVASVEAGNLKTDADGKLVLFHGQPVPYTPQPIVPQALWLTPLGGTLCLEADFPTLNRPGVNVAKANTALVNWSQRTALGRDQRVVIVRAGRLAPFGHAASRTDISERRVENGHASLFKESYVTVTEPVRIYSPASMPNDARAFPFAEVEVLTRTVKLQDANDGASGPLVPPVKFDVRATDRRGTRVSFAIEMTWAALDKSADELKVGYSGGPNGGGLAAPRRTAALHGASLLLVTQGTDPAPVHAVDRARFAADVFHDVVVPTVEQFEVEVPGSTEFAGGRRTVQTVWTGKYIESGLDSTIGAYLTRTDKDIEKPDILLAPVELFRAGAKASTEATGGLMTPTLRVQGFATKLGVIAGSGPAADAVAFAANPLTGISADMAPAELQKLLAPYLPEIKLLGLLNLADLVNVADLIGTTVGTTPNIATVLPQLQRQVDAAGHGKTLLTLTIAGEGASRIHVGPLFFQRGKGFKLHVEAVADGFAPNAISGSLEHFDIGFTLPGDNDIALRFAGLRFETTNAKPDFGLTFATPPLKVKGPLSFIADLLALVPQQAFEDPPDVQILPSGVDASYTLALPPLALGAFALSGIGFSAGFKLPFLGERPSLRLALASRESPFSLLIACLGGGGFVGIELDTAGLRQVEVSLEAHAGVTLNLGVAKGAVLARLGIYFRLQLSDNNGTDVLLEGFFEVSGAVCVLAIITVSIVANLVLAYETTGNKVAGRATVSVGVKVLFVKKTVSFAIERTFAGSGADPGFQDVFPTPDTFTRYCEAYA